jgi:hypothetical protein
MACGRNVKSTVSSCFFHNSLEDVDADRCAPHQARQPLERPATWHGLQENMTTKFSDQLKQMKQ